MDVQESAGSVLEGPGIDTAIARAKALFFLAAGLSLLLSIYYFFVVGDQERGIFVGIWVPSILSAGNLLIGGARE